MNNDKDVKFFCKDFIDIALKTGRSIKKSKKYNLVHEIPVFDTKDNLLFIAFSDSHFIVSIGQV